MRGGLGRAKAAGVQGAEKREGHHTEDGHSQRVPEVRAAAAARCKRAWRNTSSGSDWQGARSTSVSARVGHHAVARFEGFVAHAWTPVSIG